MSETYGWTPSQINELTLFQAAVYFGGITPEHGQVKIAPGDLPAYLEHCREIK